MAGVTRMYVSVAVGAFPVPYEPTRTPDWTHGGIGGTGAHTARVLRSLGNAVDFCTVGGADLAGQLIWSGLRERGLLGPGAIVAPESSVGTVLIAPDGRRMGQPVPGSLNDVDYPRELFVRLATGADLAVLTNTAFVRPLLEPARGLGLPIAVDVHLVSDLADPGKEPWFDAADILFCSHEKLPCSPEAWITDVFDRYPGVLIVGVGRGSDGCTLGLRDGRLISAGAVTSRGVRNTSGAGDSLFASFLHGWLASGNEVEALCQAVIHAGWAIGGEWPFEEELTAAQLRRLLACHPVPVRLDRWK